MDLGNVASAALAVTLDRTAPAAFTPTPPTSGTAGAPVVYNAQHPEEGTAGFSYSLSSAPTGATINATTGVLNWTLFDFRPDWMGKKEQVFGIVRTDGSLKPSGILLRDTYARWAKQHPAPW